MKSYRSVGDVAFRTGIGRRERPLWITIVREAVAWDTFKEQAPSREGGEASAQDRNEQGIPDRCAGQLDRRGHRTSVVSHVWEGRLPG